MKRRIFISFTLLIIMLMAAFVFFINRSLSETIRQQYVIHFQNELNLLVYLLDDTEQNDRQLANYATDLKRFDNTRLTLIDQHGKVIYDSFEQAFAMENHLNRPEIKQLLEGANYGVALRHSDTLGEDFIYVTKSVKRQDDDLFLRISAPLTQLSQLNRNNIKLAVFFAIIAGALTLLIAWIASERITKPIKALIRSTDLIAQGEYSADISVESDAEMAHLANAYNVMRSNLATTMSDLTTRNAELNAMLNSMVSGIIALDLKQEILLINQKCTEILEIPNDFIKVSSSIYKLVDNQQIIDLIKAACSADDMFSQKIHYNTSDKVLRVYAQPIKTEGDILMGTMIVFEDITTIQRLERVRSEFVSNVTHELKTPLTSILGFVDTLKSGAINNADKAERFLAIIESEATRLNRLISDILLLSEIETMQTEIDKDIIDIGDVIDEVIAMLAVNIGQKAIELNFFKTQKVLLAANYDHIKQLIINLVDNAIKYTEEGYVSVYLTEDDQHIKIEVADSGVGFDEAEKARLFERFYRIDKARSRKVGGTGLGLSIVKHIVSLYRGDITVKSGKGEGTSFTISLPKSN